MNDLNKLIYENLEYLDVRKDREVLAEKWDQTGLLEGLKSDADKLDMSQLLENEAKVLHNQGAVLNEAGSQTTDVIGFQSIALPLVRRVFGGLIANNLISVQPLSTPAGLIFYLDYTFGNGSKGGVNNKDWTSGGSVYGDPKGSSIASTGPYGTAGHYYLNHSYSRYETTGAVKVQSSGIVANFTDVDYDPDLSGAWKDGSLYSASFDYDEFSLSNFDTTNITSVRFSGTATVGFDDVVAVYPRHNKLTGTVVTIFFSSSANIVSGTAGFKLSYVRKSAINADVSGTSYVPEFESDFSTDAIPEIDVDISSDYITTDTRKLKVKWTPEMAQDLAAYQNVDAEALLTQILAEQMAMEIDIEILSKLVAAARATGQAGDRLIRYWDARPNQYVNKKTGEPISGPTLYVNLFEWYQTLMKPINELSNEIQRRTLRTGANFIVASPEVCTILEMLSTYQTDFTGDPTTSQYGVGFTKAGTLSSRYTVYKCPYFLKQTMLIGYKGDEFAAAGAVFSPYVPLIITPTIFSPEDFTPRVGAMSRYGYKTINAGFYGLVHIKNLDF